MTGGRAEERGGPAEVARVTEVKQRLDGREDRFDCELVHRRSGLAVVNFRIDRPLFGLPAPVHSYGLFWADRPYNCYYVVQPVSGEVAMHRFDVVKDVRPGRPGDPEVRYVDLILDLRIDRGGPPRWEDEDELEEAQRSGLLTATDRAEVDRARRLLDDGLDAIVAEVRGVLRALGRLPEPGAAGG